MTHQDIWDDSALVSSWNEALAEYKVSTLHNATTKCTEELTIPLQKYHSIHATGGNLQDLLSEYRGPPILSLPHRPPS